MKNSLNKRMLLLFLPVLCLLSACGTSFTENEIPASAETFFYPAEKDLTVPGLAGNYDILFLSDTHVIRLDGTEDGQVTENALPRTDMFRDDNGTASADNFPRWMDYAKHRNVDLILFGGDIVDFPSKSNIALLEENLENQAIPYVYVLGNHDWTYPWEYMTPVGEKEYRPLFEPFTGENTAASLTDFGEFVVLAVDNSSNQVRPDAMPVAEQALAMGKPVLVMLHVPFSTEPLLEKASAVWESPVSAGMEDKGGFDMDETTASFYRKICAEDSPVVCILAGHVHFADDSMLEGRIPQFVSGAGYENEAVMLHIHG